MRITELQKISDDLCDKLTIPRILIIITQRMRPRAIGLYCGDSIKIRTDSKSVLLHELAHHLDRTRFKNCVPGYYKMEMWPAMELSHIDETGQKWYAATGKLHEIYIHLGSSHGKNFKKCLREIQELSQ